jgi:hypothetical protein
MEIYLLGFHNSPESIIQPNQELRYVILPCGNSWTKMKELNEFYIKILDWIEILLLQD